MSARRGANTAAAAAFVATILAGAAAIVSWSALEYFEKRKVTMLGACTGAIAGLVAVTPAAGYVTPIGALVLGALVCPFCYGAILVKGKLGYDDSLDVFGVHGVGALVGVLALGVLATPDLTGGTGGLFNGNADLLFAQAIAVVAVAAYTVVVTVAILRRARPFSGPARQCRGRRPGPRPDPARPARLHDGRRRADRYRPQLRPTGPRRSSARPTSTSTVAGRQLRRRGRRTRPRNPWTTSDVAMLGQGFDGRLAGGLATVSEVDRDDREDLELGLGMLSRLLVDPSRARFQASSQSSLGHVRSVARLGTRASRAIRSSRRRTASRSTMPSDRASR